MKKTIKLFGLFAVAAMTIIGCAKEVDAPEEATNETPTEQSTFTHTVTITAGAPTTKTVINEGETSASFKWSSDDATRFHVWENDVKGTAVTLTSEDEYETMKLTATFASVSAASYEYTAYLAKNEYDDDGDKYPQVPSEQTCTATSYDPNADILVAQPVTSVGSTLDEIEMKFGRPCVINKMTLKGLTAGETVSSVEIYADKPLTGYYDIDNTSWTGESRKITLTTSQVVPANGEVSVYFVTIPVASAKLTVTAVTNAHVYNKTFGKTINFVLDQVTKFGVSSLGMFKFRDVITQSLTGLSTTESGYSSWSDKSYAGTGHSNAVFAGNTNRGVSYIQVRGKDNSGIITTTSGGSLKRVFVAYNDSQAIQNGRTMAVLGKNGVYSATSNLYNDSTKGTEAGTFTYHTGDKVNYVNVDSYYEYVAFLPNGAIYFDEIDIFWDDAKSDSGLKWTADGNAGDAVESATATLNTGDDLMPEAVLYNPNNIDLSVITFSSSNTDVATIGEHTGIITLVGEGDTDIKAVYAGNSTLKPASIKYTLSVTDNRSTCATPTFSPAAGSVAANTVVRISANTANATVYYKIGSTPTTSSYDGISTLKDASDKPYIDVTIDVAKTVYAIAVKDDWKDSSTGSATYTITGVATPLSAPTNVAFTSMTSNSFAASWTAAAHASGYSWKLSTSSDPSAAAISGGTGSIQSGSTVSLSVTENITLDSKTAYYLHIKSVGDGTSYSDSDYESIHIKFYSLTPNQSSTGSSATSYITSLTEFTYDGIKWEMNQWNPKSLQIKTNQSNASSEFRFYNNSAFSGRISKVIITFAALTVLDSSKLMFLGGTSAVTDTTGGAAGTWNSTAKTLSWTPGSSYNYTYFAFYQNGKAASGTNNLASSNAIIVLYE